jgi:hypothetical protein
MDQEQHEEPQRRPGTFLPGHDPRRSKPEQRRGAHHKMAQAIKKGIFKGAVAHGRDGKGDGGLDGYFEFLAAKHPKVFAGLLGRLLPLHLKTDVAAAGVNTNFTINVVGVPSGTMFSKAEIESMQLDELPPMIEHERAPALVIDDDDDDEPPPAA